MCHQTLSLVWQRADPPRGRKYSKRRCESLKMYNQSKQPVKEAQQTRRISNAAPRRTSGHVRISKVPTGLGTEPLNVVVLGASYAGLAVAHHFLDHTINQLRITSSAPNYRLIVVSPSTPILERCRSTRAGFTGVTKRRSTVHTYRASSPSSPCSQPQHCSRRGDRVGHKRRNSDSRAHRQHSTEESESD